ncbi:hemagglutinin [Bdellovibrio sp. ArHS]|uniref:hemagglutinin n=1 Tax=Bdellovibrio sp. ArHS TaxID=1569284 RepID=UPI0025B88AE1|nr:hemagglutinin [Bdellovibrio sp. ArHS]
MVSFITIGIFICATLAGCIKADIKHPDLVPTLKSTSPSYYTNDASIKVKVQFNRRPTTIVDSEFKVNNATIVSITPLDDFTYLVELTPVAEGRVILSLPEGAALDERGKKSFSSENFEVYYDNSIPVVGAVQILPAAVSPNPRPVIDGQTEPKAIVTLYNSIACSGLKLADTQADSVTGTFHFPVANALTVEGPYAWSVLTQDAAGNTYCYPYPLPYVFDATAPSAPAISLPYAIQDSPVIIDVTSCDDTNQLPDSYFQVAFAQDGGPAPDFTDSSWGNCATGNNYVTVTGSQGLHTLTMWVRDEAGNISQSNSVSFTLDTTIPSLTLPTAISLNRNSSATELFDDASVDSDEEGLGSYSLGTASSPQCSDYGSVTINSATGALTYTPTAHYYNKNGATNHHGGPCNIKVQFSDQVLPTAHIKEAEVAVSVDFIDELPQITAWPGTNGTATEKCGNKCFANAIFDLSFTANPGGAGFPDPQTLTCSATTADGYYVSIASCSVSGTSGTLSLQMGSAHASSTDTTLITLTVSDGLTSVSKSFGVHVDNYVMSMYPALAVSRPLSCILCHANIQADIVMDFGVAQANYANASDILGFARINSSHMYHSDNNVIGFTVTGSLYMPNITVTDKNFIKQVSGTPNGAPVNLRSFLLNPWNYYEPQADAQGTLLTDTDGFVKVAAAPTVMAALPPINGGLTLKNSVTIRAPSDAEILALDATLSAATTAFVYKGPNSKPALSGLEIHDYGYGEFVRNNGTIVCYGSIIISGTLYLNNPDIQTDDVGCSIYVAGNVFIETNRGTAINYVGGAASPTLQITASRNLHMGIGLYDLAHIRNSNNAANDARKIANDANPSGLRDAGGTVSSIKSNENAGAWEYMTCPLRPEHAIYLETHYVSNGNYTACDASTDPWKCAMANEIFNNWIGVVTNYDHVPNVRNVYRPATNSLIDIVRAYETMCRFNGAYQMSSYSSYSWTWAGYWGEQPSKIGAPTINSYRVATVFDHLRVNAHNVHSRYYGEFRGSVISPYALFAVGNLVFKYDTRLNNVVPYPKLMVPNPIFDVQ